MYNFMISCLFIFNTHSFWCQESFLL